MTIPDEIPVAQSVGRVAAEDVVNPGAMDDAGRFTDVLVPAGVAITFSNVLDMLHVGLETVRVVP